DNVTIPPRRSHRCSQTNGHRTCGGPLVRGALVSSCALLEQRGCQLSVAAQRAAVENQGRRRKHGGTVRASLRPVVCQDVHGISRLQTATWDSEACTTAP